MGRTSALDNFNLYLSVIFKMTISNVSELIQSASSKKIWPSAKRNIYFLNQCY